MFVDTVAFRFRFFCRGLAALQTHLKDKEKDSVFSWHVLVVALLGVTDPFYISRICELAASSPKLVVYILGCVAPPEES